MRGARLAFRAETRSVFLDDARPETSVPGASRGGPSHRDAAPRMLTQSAGVCADDTTTGSNAANRRARVVLYHQYVVPKIYESTLSKTRRRPRSSTFARYTPSPCRDCL